MAINQIHKADKPADLFEIFNLFALSLFLHSCIFAANPGVLSRHAGTAMALPRKKHLTRHFPRHFPDWCSFKRTETSKARQCCQAMPNSKSQNITKHVMKRLKRYEKWDQVMKSPYCNSLIMSHLSKSEWDERGVSQSLMRNLRRVDGLTRMTDSITNKKVLTVSFYQ